MALYKQKDSGNWWISIYRPGQKRLRFSSGTTDRSRAAATEALIVSAQKGNLVREKLFSAIDALMGWDHLPGLAVDELWDIYLQTKPVLGAHTLRQRKTWCNTFVAWMQQRYPTTKELHGITAQQAFAFSDWLLEERGGKGKTHNNRISHLKTVFRAVAPRANITNNPFGMHSRMSTEDSLHGRAFTKAEQKAIFTQCDVAGNDWRAACTLAKYSGARLKDIALLKWEQVGENAIDITPHKTRRHGIRAMIPIHPAVAEELAGLDRSSEYVFQALASRYVDKSNPQSGFMDEVLNPCRIKKEGAYITFHCWRHTFRTAMAAARVPQEVAMKIAGWTNQDTAELYNHDFSQMQEAINALA